MGGWVGVGRKGEKRGREEVVAETVLTHSLRAMSS